MPYALPGGPFTTYQGNKNRVKEQLYPLIAGVLVLVGLTLWAGADYFGLLKNFGQYLVSFGDSMPARGQFELASTGILIGSIIVIDLVAAIVLVGPITHVLCGPMKGESKLKKLLQRIGFPVFAIFLVILLEETLARLFFMGVMGRFLPGGMFLWGVIGNAVWALIHLGNLEEPKDRNPLRVLPQFVCGLFFMFIYAQFGFLWVVVAHFSYDAVLFAMIKRKDGLKEDISYGLYWIAIAVVSGIFLAANQESLAIMQGWLAGSFEREPGAAFLDYFLVLVSVSAFTAALLSIAGYDVVGTKKEPGGLIGIVLDIPIILGLVLLGTWTGARLGADMLSVVVGLSVALTVLGQADTLSALARRWFSGLISAFLITSLVVTLGFASAFLLMLMYFPVLLVPLAISRTAGKFSYGNGD